MRTTADLLGFIFGFLVTLVVFALPVVFLILKFMK